jgi:UDP-N-acetylglucosamine 2-epimerase
MPKECNRVVTDHLSDLLFVTEESALRNLEHEGIAQDRVFFAGNTMIDSLRASEKKADTSSILERLGLSARSDGDDSRRLDRTYALLTLLQLARKHEAVIRNMWDGKASDQIVETLTHRYNLHLKALRVEHENNLPTESECPVR